MEIKNWPQKWVPKWIPETTPKSTLGWFPKSHWEECSQTHFGVFPKATLGCFAKPLWGVSQSHFGVFPKATLGWFLSNESAKRLISQSYFGVFPKATLGCFPKWLGVAEVRVFPKPLWEATLGNPPCTTTCTTEANKYMYIYIYNNYV